MSLSNYGVYKAWINEADFEVLVLKIPDDELEDKLAYLAREKGIIPQNLYEDFIIATCIANINQLLSHIKQQMSTPPDLMEIRKEVVVEVLKINSALEPESLIINRNHVVKLKTDAALGDGEKLLTSNKSWGLSYYDDSQGIDPNSEVADGQPETDMKTFKYTLVKKWWKRINQYIEIKQFLEEDMQNILGQNYFHDNFSFQTFIVSMCVLNAEDLFTMLDTMGISNRVAAPILIHEVYDLCIAANPFLLYENARELMDDPQENDEPQYTQEGAQSNQTSMVNQIKKQKRGKQLKFKNISKKDLLCLGGAMKKSLVGQDEAVDTIVDTIQRASVGLKDPVKPIGSFLFAGKTGCGKTKSAKVLADELIKERKNLVTIDCSEYSSDHEYSKLVGCFVPGTKVLMDGGRVKNIEKIKPGEKVITHKGRKRKVTHIHKYKQNGEMVKYTTVNSNIPVTVTKTHEILVIKGNKCQYSNRKHVTCKPTCSNKKCTDKVYKNYKMEWIPASELKKDDVLVYPIYKPTGKYPAKIDLVNYIENETRYKYNDTHVWAQKHVKIPRFIDVNEDFVRLAGYYVSEGGIGGSSKALNFTFHSKEHDYIIEVVKLIRRLFGKEVRIRIEDRSKNHSYRIWVSSKVVCNLMSKLFGHNTYVKHLPKWFCELPNNLVKNFLETAVFGDGCTVIKRRMDYSTVSPNLFFSMELLFRRLGYLTYNQLEKKENPKWHDRYRIYISGNQIEQLDNDFNFNINLGGLKQTNIQRKAWVDENYVYLQIKYIDKSHYTGNVYDLAVEEDTSYVVGNAVHNSPPGYIGHDQGGHLTNAIIENPFSVVVFDEIEKASSKVHELLLQVMDEGRLTDGKGKKVSFKNTIIIMTSNIGIKEVDKVEKTIGFGDVAKLTDSKQSTAINKAIKNKFKPEFLNRIDSVVNFKALTKKDYMQIIDIELYKLNDYLKSNSTEYKNCKIEFDKKVKNFIFKKGINEQYGARPLKRCIEKEVATPLARRLLEEKDVVDSVQVNVHKSKAVFKLKYKEVERENQELTASLKYMNK